MDSEESNMMMGHSGEEAAEMDIVAGPMVKEMVLASLEPTEMEPDDWGLDKVFGPEEEAVIKYFSPVMELLGA